MRTQNIRVLLVSENRLTRLAFRHVLRSAGDFEVIGDADHSGEPEHISRQSSPDVILLESGSLEQRILRTVAEIFHRIAEARIVIISSGRDIDAVCSLLQAGVLGYVLHRASDDELFLAIRRAASNRRFIDPRLSDSVAEMVLGRTRSPRPRSRLSKRESQVLHALAQGFTGGEISQQLDLSPKTVATYRGRICEKLQLKSRAEIVSYAITAGLLAAEE